MKSFFPYQPLRINFKGATDEEYSYRGPGEYVRPVNPDDEDLSLPEHHEPLHFVRIVLGNDSTEHIFPESALSPARYKDIGGLLDRVEDMIEQLEPMMQYLDEELKNDHTVPDYAPTESGHGYRINFQSCLERLRAIGSRYPS